MSWLEGVCEGFLSVFGLHTKTEMAVFALYEHKGVTRRLFLARNDSVFFNNNTEPMTAYRKGNIRKMVEEFNTLNDNQLAEMFGIVRDDSRGHEGYWQPLLSEYGTKVLRTDNWKEYPVDLLETVHYNAQRCLGVCVI